jgi:hypothetical protein
MLRWLFPILLCAGCGSSATVELPLSWSFVDGRRCTDAGAATIVAEVDGTVPTGMGNFPCSDGEQGKMVMLPIPSDASSLLLLAETPSGAQIYRGEITLQPPLPTPTTVVLDFTGGQ